MTTPDVRPPGDPGTLPETHAARKPVITCRGLSKTYRLGFWMNRNVQALQDLDLSVGEGEVFGFLGPNGAGKSTTIKILTRLIRPTAGEAQVLGRPPGHPEATHRLGFLPENPVFYDHLSGREVLDYYARLVGLPARQRKDRIAELLDSVNLTRAADYHVRRYSKGMVQRLGIAQTLLQSPDLVILDEPTSGLDPVGRREVRDLILSLRRAGKTVFFSTHIIPDVEAICDRVAMVIGGRLTAVGSVGELVGKEVSSIEVVLERVPAQSIAGFAGEAATIREVGAQTLVTLPSEASVEPLLRSVFDYGGRVVRLQPVRFSLEELFLKELRLAGDRSAPER